MATKKPLHCIILDVKKNEVREEDIDRTLDAYYKAIDTDQIEMPSYSIDGRRFGFICDEEGLLKANPITSAYGKDGRLGLVGNLIIGGPNFRNLTPKDVEHIRKNIVLTTQGWRLVNLDY